MVWRSADGTDGRFTVPSLISGCYLVSCYEAAQRPERGDYESVDAFQIVTLEDGQAIKDLVLDLRNSTCSLEFEIVDRNDQPLAAEIVTLEVPLDSRNRSLARIVSGFGIPARRVHRLDHLPPVDGSLTVFVKGQGPRKMDVQLRPNQTARYRVQFEDIPAQLSASSIPATAPGQVGDVGNWPNAGEPIRADAGDTRTLAPGLVLEGIVADVEGSGQASILVGPAIL